MECDKLDGLMMRLIRSAESLISDIACDILETAAEPLKMSWLLFWVVSLVLEALSALCRVMEAISSKANDDAAAACYRHSLGSCILAL